MKIVIVQSRSEKMRNFSILLIIVGIGVIGYAGYQIIASNILQQESLAEAQDMIEADEEKIDIEQFAPDIGDTAGILEIPKIDAELPIIEGTDEDELEKGVGHYRGTAYPLENDQILLSGHRDTVFRDMGELEIGDTFIIKLPYGEFAYEIYETFIVDADDTTVIQSTAPDEVLTVSTCYPFNFIGSAPERYIINAHPIYE